MRHWLLALMIVLLPLRGWMGDAMATDMAISMTARVAVSAAVSVANTTKIIAAGAYETRASGHFDHKTQVVTVIAAPAPLIAVAQAQPDCSGHATGVQAPLANGHNSNAMPDSQGEHCTPCQSCQACHTVALTPTALGPRPVFNAPTRLSAAAAPFASADMTRGQKPAIS